jgi:hypothetical protein
MIEAARTSETLVNFYQTTRRYNPEDSHLRTHCRENLKSCRRIRKDRNCPNWRKVKWMHFEKAKINSLCYKTSLDDGISGSQKE